MASTRASAEPAPYRVLTLGGDPVKWLPNGPQSRILLSYKIADRRIDQPDAINCKGIRPPTSVLQRSKIEPNAFRAALGTAFRRWRDVADIMFVEAAPGERAHIVVGEQTDPIGFAFTNLDLANELHNGIRPIVGASICLNPRQHWKIGYDGNLSVYDLVHTFAHEIGHVIGLDHPDGRTHLMSFRYSETLTGLSEGDRLGAVALYGPSRMRSEIVVLPAQHGSHAPAQISTTIGRSIKGSSPN
jgi:hypothetical protein